MLKIKESRHAYLFNSSENKGDEFNMKKKSPIVGKKIKAMTDGGWELTGVVTHDKNDRVVLQIDSGEILLLFKKKISAVLILSEAVIEKPQATTPIRQEPVNNDNFCSLSLQKKMPQIT